MALVVLVALVAPPAPVAPVELAALAAQGQPNEIRDRQNRGEESAPARTIRVLGAMPELYCQKMMALYSVFGRVRMTARGERRGQWTAYSRVNFWGDRETIDELIEELQNAPPELRAAWVQERVVSDVPRGGARVGARFAQSRPSGHIQKIRQRFLHWWPGDVF